MARSWCLCWMAAAACASGGRELPDAPPIDACVEQTFYTDMDGDGHGDATKPVQACTQPAGAVMTSDDCDDGNAQRYPGAPEVCDTIDNDCNPATVETCPIGCTPLRRPPPDDKAHSYLVCNTMATWTNASALCANAMYKLVEIDDAAENTYVRSIADAAFGTGTIFQIGATDAATEGVWLWDGGTTQFWQGTAAPTGMAVGGHFSKWNAGEPNNANGTEDCSQMRNDDTWNDEACSTSLQFICRR